MHAISVINHSKGLDLHCLDETFRSVENKSTFLGNLHEVVEISVMVFVILAVDNDIVGDPDGAWALTEDLIHALLECILWDVQSKGKPLEPEVSDGAVEGRELQWLFIELDWPVAMVRIQLAEHLGAAEAIGDLLQCGGLVVHPLDALVQWSRVETDS